MSQLPVNWVKAPLADLCEKISDGSHNPPKAKDRGLPMLSARNVRGRKIVFDEFRLISETDFAEENRRTRVSNGDVLLTIVGAIGRTAVVPVATQPFTLQRSVAVLKLRQGDPRFLSYALEAPAVQVYLQENAKGTAQKGIYLKALASVEIPVSPLPEQERVADKLDTVLTRVDAVNARLARIAPLLKRFRQSVLVAASSGRLTEDWRGSGLVDWRSKQIQEICLSVSDGDHQAPPQVTSGIPFVTISALNGGRLDLSKATRYVPDTYFSALDEKRRPKRGDVLFSVTGSIGIPALVATDEPFTFQRHIAILKPDSRQVSSAYLRHLLESTHVNEQAIAVATGTAQMTIPLGGLRRIEVSLPPTEEQAEIVRRVETLFAFADRLEARLQAAQTATDRLTPALLAKAFRGELVPQDPNDEPASELLKRLAISAATAAPTRGRRKAANVTP